MEKKAVRFANRIRSILDRKHSVGRQIVSWDDVNGDNINGYNMRQYKGIKLRIRIRQHLCRYPSTQ